MTILSTLPLPFWASFLTALGWLYCIWAISWPRLFYSAALQRTHRDYLGHKFGRRIYWQMRYRTALLLAACSLLPWLALLLGTNLIPRLLLGLATVLCSLTWLTRPPGEILGLIERPGKMGLVVIGSRNLLRASVIFILCGMIPSLLIGTGIHMLVSV